MDVLARFGENCFALILPHTGSHSAVVAERLRETVGSVSVESGRKGSKLHAEVQTGVARYPKHAASAEEMLEAAANDMGISLDELRGTQQEQLKRAA
jgi:diguanylate cyclase (GGDEF)-like protein